MGQVKFTTCDEMPQSFSDGAIGQIGSGVRIRTVFRIYARRPRPNSLLRRLEIQ